MSQTTMLPRRLVVAVGLKIEAAIRFLEGGGERAIVAEVEEAMPALRGETGTHIVAGDA